jgi:hypothetical protein
MKMRRNLTRAMLVALSLMASMPVLAVDVIDDPTQIDERATQLIQTTNSLCWEMHRFHQQQPGYRESYRAAKEIWSRAGQLQEALRAGPVETEVLLGQITAMNDLFSQVESTLSKWENGDRSLIPVNNGPPLLRTVVTPGVAVDIPFIGVRVGGGGREVVVAEDGPAQPERKRLHPNSRGSKRSLEREFAAVDVALKYLSEDANLSSQPNPAAPADLSENARNAKSRPFIAEKSSHSTNSQITSMNHTISAVSHFICSLFRSASQQSNHVSIEETLNSISVLRPI